MTLIATTIAALATYAGFDSTVEPVRPHHRPPPMRRAVAAGTAKAGRARAASVPTCRAATGLRIAHCDAERGC